MRNRTILTIALALGFLGFGGAAVALTAYGLPVTPDTSLVSLVCFIALLVVGRRDK